MAADPQVLAFVHRGGRNPPGYNRKELRVQTHPQIRPRRDLLQSLANLFKSSPCLLHQILHPLPHALGLALRSQQLHLSGELVDIAGEREELLGDFASEAPEFGVITIGRIVAAAHSGGLGLEEGGAFEGHGGRLLSAERKGLVPGMDVETVMEG